MMDEMNYYEKTEKNFKIKKVNERNKKHSLLKNKILYANQNISILVFKLIIFTDIIINILSKEYLKQFNSHYSYITLNIMKKENHTLIYNNSIKCPDEIYINGNNVSEIMFKTIVLNETSNEIKLVWLQEINNTENMFRDSNTITDIDLSYFNTSSVKSTKNMFYNRSKSLFINFSNIKTS